MNSYHNKYGFERHCWAEIDLDALRDNFAYVRQVAGGPVCAVVKADAYGHGAVAVARALHQAGAASFAVSCLSEARHLRRHGVTLPIIVLGYTDPRFARDLAHQGITQAVFSPEYAAALSAAAAEAGVSVACHLKVDTGMGRLGFGVRGDFDRALAQLKACYGLPGLSITGVFQHFAAADSDDAGDIAFTEAQQALFERTLQALRQAGCPTGVVHSANSAAQLRHPEWRGSMTRAGIVLYGLDPSPEARFPALRPVMSLKTVVTHLNRLHPGESVSYGRTYTADRERLTATVHDPGGHRAVRAGPQPRSPLPRPAAGHEPENGGDPPEPAAPRRERELRPHLHRRQGTADRHRGRGLCRRVPPAAFGVGRRRRDAGARLPRAGAGAGLHGPDGP